MAEFGLEDVVGRTFEKLAPRFREISWRLFEIEGHVDQGFLTLENFLIVKREIALLRVVIEDLPVLAADTRALTGSDTGSHIAS